MLLKLFLYNSYLLILLANNMKISKTYQYSSTEFVNNFIIQHVVLQNNDINNI